MNTKLKYGCFTLLSVMLVTASLAQMPDAGVKAQSAVSLDNPMVTAELPTRLGLNEFVSRLRTANKAIQSKQKERDITATSIERAEAAFQPIAVLSAINGLNRQKNTYEESLVREDKDFYQRKGIDYSAGVSKLLPTGGKLEVKATLSRFLTNINQLADRPEGSKDNRTSLGFSLTQPLARDAGSEVTHARLQVAELDTKTADYASRETEVSILAEGLMAYYDLVLAQQRVTVAQEKLDTAKRLLEELRALQQQGRLPASDLWEVQNSLSRFQASFSEARQIERERGNRLNTLLMQAVNPQTEKIQAIDPLPSVVAAPIIFEHSLGIALENRDDFRQRKLQAEREGIQLAYAKNQKLPRIDLIASYAHNGLEYDPGDAFAWNRIDDYPSWTIGFQVTIPVGENRQAKADLQAAQLRREDALLSLKAMEVAIANDIDTSLGQRQSTTERWQWWRDIAQRESQQLELERQRFLSGRSDTREILMREERAINARLAVIEQQTAYAKAEVLLEAAQGTLLGKFSR